jgi:glycosyltransferase involved in cell wall biosynthesis
LGQKPVRPSPSSSPSCRGSSHNLRVTHVNVVRPIGYPEPDALLDSWPTLVAVAASVARAGAQVTVIQSFHHDAEIVRDSVCFRFVQEFALPGRATGLRPRLIAAAARDTRPDVIHVNGLEFAQHTRTLCRIGVPVLAQDHASRPGIRRNRRQRALAHVAGVAFTAAEQAEPFVAEGSIRRATPIFEVPESSTRFVAGSRSEARLETGISGDPAVLWVGRLDENKDPLTILAAVEQACVALPTLELWCCFHEATLIESVRKRIAASPELTARVHLIGRVPNDQLEFYYRAADFFMLGSHHEGSGYALLEALACGAIPIVSDIPAFRAVTGRKIGALVKPGNVEGFAAALVELAGVSRGHLRRRVVAHFTEALSFDRLGARLIEVYSTLARSCS